jgi:hypothetical protein
VGIQARFFAMTRPLDLPALPFLDAMGRLASHLREASIKRAGIPTSRLECGHARKSFRIS